MKKNILTFLLLGFAGFIFAEKIVLLPDLQRPGNIIVDQGQILVTEFPSIYIYSLEDFKLIKKFGKQGEGPREFAGYVRIQKDPEHPENILVGSNMKISYFTRDGKFVKEVRSSTSTGNVYKPLGKKYVSYGGYRDRDTETNYQTINLYDSNLKKIKEVYKQKGFFQQGRKINALGAWGAWFRLFDNKIFITGGKDGYIFVYDDNGDNLFSIENKAEKIKVTEKDKARYHNYFKTDPQTRLQYKAFKSLITFPSYFPRIRGMDVVDNKIYVNGYLREDGKTEFYIYDLKGNLLKEKVALFLPERDFRGLYPYTIKNGNVFQLVDNDVKEEWELHIHNIE
ncbi:MAG: hypothetical protein KAT34_13405 [Candidatus Aminicenantes bacterium]|nr:hypothetical protein [Candidatus Aminicenantes bacterium]